MAVDVRDRLAPPLREAPDGRTALAVLDLEVIEEDLFRANAVFEDPFALYGGQVAAQALRAAGLTVPAERTPHSLHGYFLRGGNAALPTVFRVDRDRDGRSFSARRVVAIQRGEVIFSIAASFHIGQEEPDHQVDPAPEAEDVATLRSCSIPRLLSFEGRMPTQPYEGAERPTRFWARCTDLLPDASLPGSAVLHAALLTYLSDISTGLAPLHDVDHRSGSSLDHAIWFHRPVRMDEWVLLDVVPRTVGQGRGWYTGTAHDSAGRLVASLTQEALFRKRASLDRAKQARAERHRAGG
ncbi:acyl-CoA thioesterase [Pseudonocardia pini]|uniref:acyl-CoA thioesterase n=1 Tax=Pseudonocardia pini TaxID=2758030 RepID=UPI0028A9F155|nr:acyl-CoA thioesterase domain-containing protein [Pseudonocardia pini]